MLRQALQRAVRRSSSISPRAGRPAAVPSRTLTSITAASLSRPSLASASHSLARATIPQSRGVSSTPHGDPSVDPSIPIRDLTDDEYHELSDESMDTLHEGLEALVEDFGPPEWEVEYSSGVMTLTLPPHGTYVINKQPPNHQIWVSSPFSGPSRFSLSPDGVWVHHRRQGVQLGALLDGELKKLVEGDEWEGVGLK